MNNATLLYNLQIIFSFTPNKKPGFIIISILVAVCSLSLLTGCSQSYSSEEESISKQFSIVDYDLQLDTVSSGYDGVTCWFHPRAGMIPGDPNTIVLLMQKWHLSASDLFLPLNEIRTEDNGKTWTEPVVHKNTLGRHQIAPGVEVGVCDFTPKWHAKSGKLLGTGHTVVYENDKLLKVRPRSTAWSVYDSSSQTWSPWAILTMPDTVKFYNAGAGSTQRVDLSNGDILLPIYFKSKDSENYSTTVVRCTFDGEQLTYVEHGDELSIDVVRGLYEPSLTHYKGRYYLTMRNDKHGYVAVGEDGLHFDSLRVWHFDDGEELGNYNTQQHWVTHSDGLFLTYTRKGADNDHVIRHRAPLFIAQVDPERLVVMRGTERILIPNKGAMLGNFSVMNYGEGETWITDAEGMKPNGVEQHGANARVYAARILWKKPNRNWDKN